MDQSSLLRTGLDIADSILGGDPTWPRQLVEGLDVAMGADTVGFAAWPRGSFLETRSENTGGPPLSMEERRMWVGQLQSYPFFRALLARREMRAIRTSDCVDSMRDFRRSDVYNDLLAPRAARYQANFALLDADELAIVGLYRYAHDFDPTEIQALEVARRPIAAALAYRNAVEAIDGLIPDRQAGEEKLTNREQDVLALVAGGSTNLQIAHRLGITERTVRKHIEGIYQHLRINNRVAAARWWAHRGDPKGPPGAAG